MKNGLVLIVVVCSVRVALGIESHSVSPLFQSTPGMESLAPAGKSTADTCSPLRNPTPVIPPVAMVSAPPVRTPAPLSAPLTLPAAVVSTPVVSISKAPVAPERTPTILPSLAPDLVCTSASTGYVVEYTAQAPGRPGKVAVSRGSDFRREYTCPVGEACDARFAEYWSGFITDAMNFVIRPRPDGRSTRTLPDLKCNGEAPELMKLIGKL